MPDMGLALMLAAAIAVGPGERCETPAQASRMVKDGDVVRIQPGVYSDVATWNAGNLTLEGVSGPGKTVIRHGAGRLAGGKGLWVLNGTNITVKGIAFEGAKCQDRNGAGLWIGAPAGETRVVDCRFVRDENGILSSAQPEAAITIRNSEFCDCGYGDGYSHNIYVGKVKRLRCEQIVSDHCRKGHCLKSRALATEIVDSKFDDGDDGASSYLVNCPNGGKVRMARCRLVQSPAASNGTMVSIGEEGPYPGTDFVDDGNTYENRRDAGRKLVLRR